MANSTKTIEQLIVEKHITSLHQGFHLWPKLKNGNLPALGDHRWTADLILSTWAQAETGKPPTNGLEYRVGNSGGGFDALDFKFLPQDQRLSDDVAVDLSIPLNRRPYDRRIEIPIPFYGAGMSFGSISEQVMCAEPKRPRHGRPSRARVKEDTRTRCSPIKTTSSPKLPPACSE